MYFEIVDVKSMQVLYSSKQASVVKYDFFGEHLDRLNCCELLPADDIDTILTGDLLFKIRNGHSYNGNTLCRFSVNSAFLGSQLDLTRDELDPTQFKKDNRFADYFVLSLLTERGCPECDSSNELNELCQDCVKDLENELGAWSYIQGTLHDLFEDPKKLPSYSKAQKLHFLGEKADYEETLGLHKSELSKVKLITGSVRKDTNHQDINVQMGGDQRVSVSKKIFNVSSSDEPSKSQSNESSPQRLHRMGTMFENLLDENNEYTPDFNQEVRRKHTYYVKSEKLLNQEQEQKIEEGKYEIDIPEGESNGSQSEDQDQNQRDTIFWKRREVAEGSLYQDILKSNLERYVEDKVTKFENENPMPRGIEESNQIPREEEKEESMAAHLAYVDNKHHINNEITQVKEGTVPENNENYGEEEGSFDVINRDSGLPDEKLKDKIYEDSDNAARRNKFIQHRMTHVIGDDYLQTTPEEDKYLDDVDAPLNYLR